MNNRNLPLLGVAVLVLLVAGVGMYALMQDRDLPNENVSTNTSQPPITTPPVVTPPTTTTTPNTPTPTSTTDGETVIPTSTAAWKTYRHAKEYTVKYPGTFLLQEGGDLGGGYLGVGTMHAKISFPAGSFAKDKSNFITAHFAVSRRALQTQIVPLSNCTDFTDLDLNEDDKPVRRLINGINWYMLHRDEAAAGNRFATDIYRTIHKNQCYEVALTVQTGVKENYDPPVYEFKTSKALDILETMLETFDLST